MIYKQLQYFIIMGLLSFYSLPAFSSVDIESNNQAARTVSQKFDYSQLIELHKQLFHQEKSPSKVAINGWRWVSVIVDKPSSFMVEFYDKPFTQGGKGMSFVTRREAFEGNFKLIDSMGPNAQDTEDVIFSQAKIVRVTSDNKSVGRIGLELIVRGLDKNHLLRIAATEDVPDTNVSFYVYLEDGWTPIFKLPIDMSVKEYSIDW